MQPMTDPTNEVVSRDDLVDRARRGDHEAYRRLVEAVIGRMRRSARLLLHDGSRADDAVQEALVAAWRSLPGLRDPSRFDAWLNRLLVHACYRVARRERRQSIIEIPSPGLSHGLVPDTERDVADRDELERAFRHLTYDQRVVLVLVYYADLTLADVAATLGIPTSTAKSRLYRALESLRAGMAAGEQTSLTVRGRTA
jgi:RNA polymerase sigma-70 factor (ECF subfamily)